MKAHATLAGLLLGLAALATDAADFKLGPITIAQPYARATAAGQPMGGGFMTLVNAGAADRLVAASAEVAASVELHEMKMDGDVMRMRQVDAIDLAAGKTTELKPGGYHMMFIGLKAPLTAGTRFPVKLKFEKAGEVTVQATVMPLAVR